MGMILFFKVSICMTKITQLEIMYRALLCPHPTQNCALADLDCPTVHGHKLHPCQLHTKQLNHIIKIFLSDGDLSSTGPTLLVAVQPAVYLHSAQQTFLLILVTGVNLFTAYQTFACYWDRLAIPTEVCLKKLGSNSACL